MSFLKMILYTYYCYQFLVKNFLMSSECFQSDVLFFILNCIIMNFLQMKEFINSWNADVENLNIESWVSYKYIHYDTETFITCTVNTLLVHCFSLKNDITQQCFILDV